MNCKPNDLACIVRVPPCESAIEAALREQLIGKFVRVVALRPASEETWEIVEPIRISLPCGHATLTCDLTGIEDSVLQPVRGMPVHDEQLDEVTA